MSDPTSLISPLPNAVAVLPQIDAAPEVAPTLTIVPWADPVIETLGYDPRSWYVEQFWLGIIGPTSTWLVRRMVAGFDTEPDGFALHLDETARALGLGGREGRHSPFQRALGRCVSFRLARPEEAGTLAVKRRLPPLPRRHIERLPLALQRLHADWTETQERAAVLDEGRNRARRLALKLLDIGAERQAVELQLGRWRVHPAVAYEATEWALALQHHPSR